MYLFKHFTTLITLHKVKMYCTILNYFILFCCELSFLSAYAD
nr:MAG TPA: hypothetical protein [Caudoviricetes sp.]DAH44090.1 MAG TPA: hypothetical protein [Caudoviricetes sp.]